jgi:hypothetical protein
MKQTIKIQLHGHVIRIFTDGSGGGTIETDLKSKEAGSAKYNAAIDGLESLILAHASSGVEVAHPKYIQGIEDALEAIANNT